MSFEERARAVAILPPHYNRLYSPFWVRTALRGLRVRRDAGECTRVVPAKSFKLKNMLENSYYYEEIQINFDQQVYDKYREIP